MTTAPTPSRPSHLWIAVLVLGLLVAVMALLTNLLPSWLEAAPEGFLHGASGLRLDAMRPPFTDFLRWAAVQAWVPLAGAGLLCAALAWVAQAGAGDLPRRGLRLASYAWLGALTVALTWFHGDGDMLPASAGMFLLAILLPAVNLPTAEALPDPERPIDAWGRVRSCGWLFVVVGVLVILGIEPLAARFYGAASGSDFALLSGERGDVVRVFCCDMAGLYAANGLLLVCLARLGARGHARAWWGIAVGCGLWAALELVHAVRSGVWGPHLVSLALLILTGLALAGTRKAADDTDEGEQPAAE